MGASLFSGQFCSRRHHGYNHQAKVSFINTLDMIRKQGIMHVFVWLSHMYLLGRVMPIKQLLLKAKASLKCISQISSLVTLFTSKLTEVPILLPPSSYLTCMHFPTPHSLPIALTTLPHHTPPVPYHLPQMKPTYPSTTSPPPSQPHPSTNHRMPGQFRRLRVWLGWCRR